MSNKSSIENLVKVLFEKSISGGSYEYSPAEIESNWIGGAPAKKEEIAKKEKDLNVIFPKDYKELLQITNGFKTRDDSVEPGFLPITEVDYLKHVFPFVIECYEDTLEELEDSILVGGKYEEQQFLLIPPNDKRQEWRYWKFANWIPGEEEFDGVKVYLESVISFLAKEEN